MTNESRAELHATLSHVRRAANRAMQHLIAGNTERAQYEVAALAEYAGQRERELEAQDMAEEGVEYDLATLTPGGAEE